MKQIKRDPVRVIQVGIGGMGFYLLKSLLSDFPPERVTLLGAVDPYPERSELFEELKTKSIPVRANLTDMLDSPVRPDLVVISSPLQFHVEQCLLSLNAGCHVFCEKPLGSTVQEADRLIRAIPPGGPFVRIGYQWSYSKAVLDLKKDILAGRYGKQIRAKSLHLWPRDWNYYTRNDWAGSIKDRSGRWVLDSPANSAMAHDLHNLLFLLGDRLDSSAKPIEIECELYRAFPIENYDTVASRIQTASGAELLFYAGHAVHSILGPLFSLEFESALIRFGGEFEEIVATLYDGGEKRYGSPETVHPFDKLSEAVDAVRTPRDVLCGPVAARSQTLCVNGMQDAADEIHPFPPAQVRRNVGRYWVDGLEEALKTCYDATQLPSEAGFSFARKKGRIDLSDYTFFPGGIPPLNEERGKP